MDPKTPDEALNFYNKVTIPTKERKIQEKNEEEKKRMEQEDEQKKIAEQCQREIAEQHKKEYHQRIQREDPLGNLLETIVDRIENSEEVHNNLLSHMKETGETTIELATADYNLGSYTRHGVGEERLPHRFDNSVMYQMNNFNPRLNYPITKGPFQNWEITCDKKWDFAMALIPFRTFRVTLHKPYSWLSWIPFLGL